MARAVGLDVGTRTLKLVELSGSAKAFKVQRLDRPRRCPRATGDEAERRASTSSARSSRRRRFPKDDVCASFDAGTHGLPRDHGPVPRATTRSRRSSAFEAENHLHGRAIEDVVVNWVKTGETKDGSQVLVIAAPKAELASRPRRSSAARAIEPASVDLDATALFTACDACRRLRRAPRRGPRRDRRAHDEPAHRGRRASCRPCGRSSSAPSRSRPASSTTSRSRRARRPRARCEPGAGRPGRAARARRRGSRRSTTRDRRSRSPSSRTTSSSARREEFVRKLQREITRSIASARAASPPDADPARGRRLAAARASRRRSPSASASPSSRSTSSRASATARRAPTPALEEAVSPSPSAARSALLGADPLGVELRQEEFAPTNTFDVVAHAPSRSAVTLLVALLARAHVHHEGAGRAGASSSATSRPNSVVRKAGHDLRGGREGLPADGQEQGRRPRRRTQASRGARDAPERRRTT